MTTPLIHAAALVEKVTESVTLASPAPAHEYPTDHAEDPQGHLVQEHHAPNSTAHAVHSYAPPPRANRPRSPLRTDQVWQAGRRMYVLHVIR